MSSGRRQGEDSQLSWQHCPALRWGHRVPERCIGRKVRERKEGVGQLHTFQCLRRQESEDIEVGTERLPGPPRETPVAGEVEANHSHKYIQSYRSLPKLTSIQFILCKQISVASVKEEGKISYSPDQKSFVSDDINIYLLC